MFEQNVILKKLDLEFFLFLNACHIKHSQAVKSAKQTREDGFDQPQPAGYLFFKILTLLKTMMSSQDLRAEASAMLAGG